jgi:hypothetical protein
MSHQVFHNAQSLETWYASKDIKNSKKGLITFTTCSHIFLCKKKILTLKRSKILGPLENCNNTTSMSIIKVIAVVKAYANN